MKKFAYLSLSWLAGCGHVPASTAPLSARFDAPDGLITNEFAFHNPGDAAAARSATWEMTSGSLFSRGGEAWSGVPDDRDPGPSSSSGTGSAVFRLRTQREDFGDVAVSFELMTLGMTSTRRTPPVDWDGVHVWLRYQNPYHLYAVSVNRRDDTIIIKKKLPGGESNGGTYYNLTQPTPYKVPYHRWQNVKATARDNKDGSVTLRLYVDGKQLLEATDSGQGGPPIRGAGRIGVRGDNTEFKFRGFSAETLGPEAT